MSCQEFNNKENRAACIRKFKETNFYEGEPLSVRFCDCALESLSDKYSGSVKYPDIFDDNAELIERCYNSSIIKVNPSEEVSTIAISEKDTIGHRDIYHLSIYLSNRALHQNASLNGIDANPELHLDLTVDPNDKDSVFPYEETLKNDTFHIYIDPISVTRGEIIECKVRGLYKISYMPRYDTGIHFEKTFWVNGD